MLRILLPSAIILASLWSHPSAFAEDVVAAKLHYERGTALYDLQRYLDAAKEYEAACDYNSMSTAATCPINNPTGAFLGAACGKKGDFGFNNWSTIGGIDTYGGNGATKPTCSVSSSATTTGTGAAVTGGSTICCQ